MEPPPMPRPRASAGAAGAEDLREQQATFMISSPERGSLPAAVPCYKQAAVQVLGGVIFGFCVGLLFYGVKSDLNFRAVRLCLQLPGALWLKALQCAVLPMIMFAMVEAMLMIKNLPGAASVATSVIRWYAIFPSVATLTACIFSSLLVNVAESSGGESTTIAATTTTGPDDSVLSPFLTIAMNLVPKNLVMDAANNNMLPIIIAALVFGSLVKEKEEDGSTTTVVKCIRDANDVVIAAITAIMSITPFAVASLVFKSTADKGIASFLNTVDLIIPTVISLACHFFVFYPFMLFFFAGRDPIRYMSDSLPAFAQAIGTSSSAATLPTSLKCAIEGNKIAPFIAQFVVNLGATIGMDGTAIYLICATVFLAGARGMALGPGQLVSASITAALTAAGSAPIPNASLFLLGIVMRAADESLIVTPDEIAIISGVDWMLDRIRTTVNVAGDQTVSALMDKSFGSIGGEDGDEIDMGHAKIETFVRERSKSIVSLGMGKV